MLKSPSLRNNTGMIGVHYDKNFDKYETWLPKNKKGIRTFNTPEEAFERFKAVREEHIKEVADEWKDLIDPRVYEAMYNYKVEITD